MNSFELNYFSISGFNHIYNEEEKHIKVLPYLSIVQATEGSYEISLENNKLELVEEGGFFIAPAGVKQTIIHHINNATCKMSARWLFIDVSVNRSHKIDHLYKFPLVITSELKQKLNDLFNELFIAQNELKKYACCYNILDFITLNATPTSKKIAPSIQQAMTYLIEHYNTNVTIKKLAHIANMSESNFYLVFKKQYGCSPISYLNHYRLSIAANMILNDNKNISEISYSVGINDPLYFSKLFKKTFGISPRDYKQTYTTFYQST